MRIVCRTGQPSKRTLSMNCSASRNVRDIRTSYLARCPDSIGNPKLAYQDGFSKRYILFLNLQAHCKSTVEARHHTMSLPTQYYGDGGLHNRRRITSKMSQPRLPGCIVRNAVVRRSSSLVVNFVHCSTAPLEAARPAMSVASNLVIMCSYCEPVVHCVAACIAVLKRWQPVAASY